MIGRLAILAPGLLGSSVARAAQAKGLASRIAIWARRPEVRAQLRLQPWCQESPDTLQAAVAGAQLVVIAAPVGSIVPLVREIAPHLAARAIVTDVGSVKGAICVDAEDAVRRLSSDRARFVGSHPMAGSEKTGWEHGTAQLFDGRTCFVTPSAGDFDHRKAAELISEFWRALGARVVTVEPAVHDRIVAHISHLPQLLASSLCAFLEESEPEWAAYAGGGLRDTTRIAGSDPALWKEIFAANAPAVLEAVREWRRTLDQCERDLASSDWESLAARLAEGRRFRSRLP